MAISSNSRYDEGKASYAQPTDVKETSTVGPSSISSMGSSAQNTYETTTQFDPTSQAALSSLISSLSKGKAPGYNTKDRTGVEGLLMSLLSQYSKESAFNDAQGLMALNLQKSNEQNAPAIARAIEGAGTSAGSMQALLANIAQRDASLAASALGGQQAQAYGNISQGLMGVLEALTRPDATILNTLLGALQTAKGGTVTRNASATGSTSEQKTSSGATTTSTKQIGYGNDQQQSSGPLSYIAPKDVEDTSNRGVYGGGASITNYLGL